MHASMCFANMAVLLLLGAAEGGEAMVVRRVRKLGDKTKAICWVTVLRAQSPLPSPDYDLCIC